MLGRIEVADAERDLLEPGRSLILEVGADNRPEGISVRISKVDPLDEAAGTVFLDRASAGLQLKLFKDAMLKIGYLYLDMQQPAQARQILSNLVRDYPDSTASRLAAKKLESIP